MPAYSAANRRKNLLIELGTEELPPKALKNLSLSFSQTFFQGLIAAGLVEDRGERMKSFATPRRLGVWIKGVSPRQPDSVEERRGPTLQAGYDGDGNPTPAAEGFAKSCGVAVTKLKTKKTDKGQWLVFEHKVKGCRLETVVGRCLNESIKALPIPKRMKWGSGAHEFIRPVHWLLCLYGADVIRTEALGLKSNRFTRGHRFHCPGALKIPSADRWAGTLKSEGCVIADWQMRQAAVVKQIERLAKKAGAAAVIDQKLLDEVTGLVEWPVALVGGFDHRFLKLPREVLISTMVNHQKYFCLVNDKNKLVPNFIAVSNIKSKSPKRVRQGNERVLRARLSDAEFFWHADQKVPLLQKAEELKGVLFHNKLGSVYYKTVRVQGLAEHIGVELGLDTNTMTDAASLCKADLVTDMVAEFPDLQGIIGKHYAKNQGIEKTVADAIDFHYKPRFAGDGLPPTRMAQCLALADRIDTLVGIFASDGAPTGDKDPFALRRAALGILRIMIECRIDLDLHALLKKFADICRHDGILEALGKNDRDRTYDRVALTKWCSVDGRLIDQVFAFIMERSKRYFQSQGYSHDEYASVAACHPTRPLDFALRLQAVNRFFSKKKHAAESLAAANKRIANILSRADGDVCAAHFNKELVAEKSERRLASRVEKISGRVDACFGENKYVRGLEMLADLKDPVDRFFDDVMVMHEDGAIRNNRLSLLMSIRTLFLGAADISKIKTDGMNRDHSDNR